LWPSSQLRVVRSDPLLYRFQQRFRRFDDLIGLGRRRCATLSLKNLKRTPSSVCKVRLIFTRHHICA
jgi:hypothetical protein